jgi:hypothetical protein
MSARPTCATCRWWDALPEVSEVFGMCCAKMPSGDYRRTVTIEGRRVEIEVSWPPAHRTNWCGEHQKGDDA